MQGGGEGRRRPGKRIWGTDLSGVCRDAEIWASARFLPGAETYPLATDGHTATAELQGLGCCIHWSQEPFCTENKGRRERVWPSGRFLYPQAGREGLSTRQLEDDGRARSVIPADLAESVEAFPVGQWAVLETLAACPEAREMLQDNPVLAFCIANSHEFRPSRVHASAFLAMRQYRLARRESCVWLGFPGSKAMVKLFAKVEPKAAHPSVLRLLRGALGKDPESIVRLNHLPRVNTGALSLFLQIDGAERVTPALLREVCGDAAEDEMPIASMALESLVAMRRERGEEPLTGPIASLDRLHNLYEEENQRYGYWLENKERMLLERKRAREAAREAARRARAAARETFRRVQEAEEAQRLKDHIKIMSQPFPAAPFAGDGNVSPLCSDEQLRQEGVAQRNCVGSYGLRVRCLQCYCYRILKPYRATLSIRRNTEGRWVIGELREGGNKRPHSETVVTARRWLAQQKRMGGG